MITFRIKIYKQMDGLNGILDTAGKGLMKKVSRTQLREKVWAYEDRVEAEDRGRKSDKQLNWRLKEENRWDGEDRTFREIMASQKHSKKDAF